MINKTGIDPASTLLEFEDKVYLLNEQELINPDNDESLKHDLKSIDGRFKLSNDILIHVRDSENFNAVYPTYEQYQLSDNSLSLKYKFIFEETFGDRNFLIPDMFRSNSGLLACLSRENNKKTYYLVKMETDDGKFEEIVPPLLIDDYTVFSLLALN